MRIKFYGRAESPYGDSISSATVKIYLAGTSTPATAYTSVSSTDAVSQVTTDEYGYYTFYIDAFDYDQSQRFDLVVTKLGSSTEYTFYNIQSDNIIPGTYNITQSILVAGHVTIPKGVTLNISNGISLVFSVMPEIGLYQVFTGAGTVEFPAGCRVYIDWWGDDIGTAVDNIGIIETTLVVTDVVAVAENINIPSNIDLLFDPPGKLDIETGYTVTIGKMSNLQLYQIFDGLGSVSFSSGAVKAVYPEWFGAIGDASTDDSTAIQSAFNSITSGEVSLTNIYGIGEPSWTGLAVTSKSNILVNGNNFIGGFKVLYAPTQTLGSVIVSILFTSCTNLTVSGINLNGNSIGATGIGLSSCINCRIKGNTITATGGMAGVFSLNGNNNQYTYNKVYSTYSTSRGLWIGNVVSSGLEYDAFITNNFVYDCGGTGIVASCVRGIISNNISNSNGGSGIILSANGSYRATEVIVADNICNENNFHGIQSDCLTASDYSQDIVVKGNVCNRNNLSGVYCTRARRWAITGNICNDNDISGINCYGIYIDNARDISAIGNNCSDTKVGAARTQFAGVIVLAQDGNVANVTIAGNLCRNNDDRGVSVTALTGFTVDNVSVTGNTTPDNGWCGLLVYEADTGSVTNVAVVGNVSLNNTSYNIIVQPSDTINQNNIDS